MWVLLLVSGLWLEPHQALSVSHPCRWCSTEGEGRAEVHLTQVPEANSARLAVGERETLGFGCLAHPCTCPPPSTRGSTVPPLLLSTLTCHPNTGGPRNQEACVCATQPQPSCVTAGQPLGPGTSASPARRQEAAVTRPPHSGDRETSGCDHTPGSPSGVGTILIVLI